VDAAGTTYASGFTTLVAGTSSTLVLNFGTDVDFAQVTDLGFEIRGDFSGLKPSNPDFYHISAVSHPTPGVFIPAPGAGLLSLLGVGLIGLVRRSLCRYSGEWT